MLSTHESMAPKPRKTSPRRCMIYAEFRKLRLGARLRRETGNQALWGAIMHTLKREGCTNRRAKHVVRTEGRRVPISVAAAFGKRRRATVTGDSCAGRSLESATTMANVSVISNGGQPMSPQLSADVGDSASPAFSETHAEDRPQQTSPPPSRVKRLSNVVEKTVDKLNRSLVTRSPCPTGNAPQGTPPRRIFSVTRKGKGRQTSLDGRGTNISTPPFVNLT